nr:hypothetical protein CFP56_58267 [Quercus suber]
MELNKLYAMEEDMWHQRSWSNWAKSRDKNTRYFHEKALSRKRKSTIAGLMDESNQWQEDPEVVKGIAIRYYQNLFNSNQAVVQEELLEAIDARVLEPMNALLIRDFQPSEVLKRWLTIERAERGWVFDKDCGGAGQRCWSAGA